MSNNVTEQEVSLEEIMKNADIAAGLNLDIPIVQDEEVKVESKVAPEAGKVSVPDNIEKGSYNYPMPSMKINCDLEVGVGKENKIIYVCPGRLQYFTVSAIRCCGDESIEIEYCGNNVYQGVIYGCLGCYKIVKSGIIFIPNNHLSEYPENCYPKDILSFKVESKCHNHVEFDVVFTYSRCECSCDKSCKC